jgi:hypothetical protein
MRMNDEEIINLCERYKEETLEEVKKMFQRHLEGHATYKV